MAIKKDLEDIIMIKIGSIKEIGFKIGNKERESIKVQKEISKAYGLMIKETEKENSSLLIKLFLKESGKMISLLKEKLLIAMEMSTKEI